MGPRLVGPLQNNLKTSNFCISIANLFPHSSPHMILQPNLIHTSHPHQIRRTYKLGSICQSISNTLSSLFPSILPSLGLYNLFHRFDNGWQNHCCFVCAGQIQNCWIDEFLVEDQAKKCTIQVYFDDQDACRGPPGYTLSTLIRIFQTGLTCLGPILLDFL